MIIFLFLFQFQASQILGTILLDRCSQGDLWVSRRWWCVEPFGDIQNIRDSTQSETWHWCMGRFLYISSIARAGIKNSYRMLQHAWILQTSSWIGSKKLWQKITPQLPIRSRGMRLGERFEYHVLAMSMCSLHRDSLMERQVMILVDLGHNQDQVAIR